MNWTTSLAHAAIAAPWLDAKRARGWSFVYAAVAVLAVTIYLVGSHNGIDAFGRPIGTDFASFWTAARLAFEGAPAAAWSVKTHYAAQIAAFGPDAGYAAFFYPPPFLLACLPLAVAPYTTALCLWLTATGAAWMSMARAWVRDAGATNIGWLTLLSFPAVLVNAGHGQNGFLTAGLLGFGALFHARRPWLCGVLFGCLVIKPHLATLVPVILLFTGNWRAFLAATITAVGLCLVSLALFGPEAWMAFFAASPLARATLEQDLVGYAKMQSVFAGARLVGASLATAWLVQAVVALFGVGCLWRLRRSSSAASGAALVCATLLTTPFLLDYDLTVLIVPLIWLLARAQRDVFLPWERILLLLGVALPLISRPLAMATHVPIAPLILLALLLCVVRRTEGHAATQTTFAESVA